MYHYADDLDGDGIQFLTERLFASSGRARAASSITIDGSPPPGAASLADEVIDLTEDLGTVGNSLVHEDEFTLGSFRVSGILVKPGTFLEVNQFPVGEYSAKFLLVRAINRNKVTGNVKIRGIPLGKTSSMMGKLPRKSNEVCMISYYADGSSAKSAELVDIAPSNERYRVSEEALSNQWRGTRVRGGSYVLSPHGRTDLVNLEEDGLDNTWSNRQPNQKYTVFDACSGAGGVSRGAQMAGFKIKFAVDKAEEVWDTYKTNFPNTKLFKMSLDEFLSNHTRHIRVDILHFSPPCQYFSPAHTNASAHDDDNIFALFSCNQLLKKTRPRIITVEQTFGLTQDRHAEYFHAFLADFTQFGYSVRWRIVRLCTWGAAQDRKRLIIIAAAPGERLPPFPPATHSLDGQGGLLSFNTIEKALSTVRIGDDLHDLTNARRFQPRRLPFDANCLAGTITTGGGDLYFPDGTRELTLRELASLQGFPRNHTFLGTKTSIKKQIGNAFPPNTVRVLYRHIEQWLLKEDGMKPYQPEEDLILIEDDSDSSAESNDIFDNENMSPEMDDDVMEIEQGYENRPLELDDEGDCIIDLT